MKDQLTVIKNSICFHLIKKEMLYLTMHSTHFIYGYMALDIW